MWPVALRVTLTHTLGLYQGIMEKMCVWPVALRVTLHDTQSQPLSGYNGKKCVLASHLSLLLKENIALKDEVKDLKILW